LSLSKPNITSISTRLYLQKAGLKLFLDNPVLGTGQENITNNIEPYLPEYLKTNEIFFIDRTHNEFLDIAVTQGLIGFIAYVTFWGYIMIKSVRHYFTSKNPSHQKIFIYILAGILALHIYYIMNFTTISSEVLLYSMAGYLMAEMSHKTRAV
jgi:putative inorganic carbon (HCO3(-)) transporter